MKRLITAGATDQTVYVFIMDSASTTGGGKTGLAYNTGSLVCYYVRDLGSATALTLATQTVTGAHSDGGFVEVDATNMPGIYRLDLSDAICAAGVSNVAIMLKGASGMVPLPMEIQLGGGTIGTVTNGVDIIKILGTAISSPATAGVLDVNLKNIANAAVSASTAQLGVNLVNIAGAAVSTSTAQLGVNAVQAGATAWGSGAITADSIAAGAITAAKIAAGAIDNATFAADVGSTAYATNIIALAADKAIANAALATAANLAAAKTVVDAVKVKTDYLPSATAGAAGGVFIAGSNAATSITTALTANITGNLSGSVGSVTGAVGSVTGAVGSVTGAVGSVTGAVGSVTGNVGGNVTGSVGSVVGAVGSVTAAVTLPTIPTNWITANGIAADAIGASELAADAVTEIAAGVSIPSAATIASQVRTELTTELGRIDVATSTRLATADYTAPLDAAGTRTAIGLATANLDTQLGAIAGYVDTEVGAIYTRIGAPVGASISADIAGISAGSGLDAAGVRAAIGLSSANLDTQLAAELAQATLARKLLKNRTETNPATGVMTVYDDDGVTPLYTANLYEDTAGATAYDGTAGVNRRNALS